MALAALLIGTAAGIAAFALALVLGYPLLVAQLAWWATGTVTTLLPLFAAARARVRGGLREDFATA